MDFEEACTFARQWSAERPHRSEGPADVATAAIWRRDINWPSAGSPKVTAL